MKLSQALGIVLLTVVSSTASFAFSGSKIIAKTLTPGESYKAPLNELYPYVDYSLNCTVVGGNKDENSNTALDITSDKATYFTVKKTGGSGENKSTTDHLVVDFKAKGATIRLARITNTSTITFRNLDFTDRMAIFCSADVYGT